MKRANYRFRIVLQPKKIYANLPPEYRGQIGSLLITNTTLLSNGDVELECLALESEVEDISVRIVAETI